MSPSDAAISLDGRSGVTKTLHAARKMMPFGYLLNTLEWLFIRSCERVKIEAAPRKLYDIRPRSRNFRIFSKRSKQF